MPAAGWVLLGLGALALAGALAALAGHLLR